jgi:hypothetical protein
MDLENRRSKERASVDLIVGETHDGRYTVPVLANISDEGAYIEGPYDDDYGYFSEPVLEIMLPGIPEIIWARCQVMRENTSGFFHGRALRFIEISPIHRQYIRSYIQQNRCSEN